MPTTAADIIANYRTCEFTTVFKDGAPQTWPVAPLLCEDGRFLLCTSIGLPQKAFNARRNAHVSMLFSEPTGSGIAEPGAVLIEGDAEVDDGLNTDPLADAEFATLMERIFVRQPAGAFMSTQVGRRLFPFYYIRILIRVTPRRAFFWATNDFTGAPRELDLTELSHVG